MRKYYSEPELEIRMYALSQSSYITTSDETDPLTDPDLNDRDEHDYFG